MRDRFAAMLAIVLVGGCQAQDESIGGLLNSNAQFTMSDDEYTRQSRMLNQVELSSS